MDDDQAVIGGHIRRLEISVIIQQRIKTGKSVSWRLQAVIVLHRRQPIFGRADHLLVFRIDKQYFGFTVVEVKECFFKGKSPVDRQYDSTESAGRSIETKKFQAVLSEGPDAVAFFDASRLQTAGQPIYSIFVLCEGDRTLIINFKPCRPVPITNRIAFN